MKQSTNPIKAITRTSKLLAIACIFSLALTACGAPKSNTQGAGQTVQAKEETQSQNATGQATYTSITQEEAKTLMDSEDNRIILDVRTQDEYAGGHITGAICLPNETIDEDTATELLPDKDQLILVYCRSGNRSRQASEKLAKLGYTNIKEFGGINTWEYETEVAPKS